MPKLSTVIEDFSTDTVATHPTFESLSAFRNVDGSDPAPNHILTTIRLLPRTVQGARSIFLPNPAPRQRFPYFYRPDLTRSCFINLSSAG